MDNKKLSQGLVPRQVVNKNGDLTTVYVRPNGSDADRESVSSATARPRQKTGLTEVRMAKSLGLGSSVEEIDRRSSALIDEVLGSPIALDNSETRSRFVAATAYLRARHEALLTQSSFLDDSDEIDETDETDQSRAVGDTDTAEQRGAEPRFVDQNEAKTMVLEQIRDNFPEDYRRLPVSEDLDIRAEVPTDLRNDIEQSTSRQLRAMPRAKRDERVLRLIHRVDTSRMEASQAAGKYFNKKSSSCPRTLGEAEELDRRAAQNRRQRTHEKLLRQGWGGQSETRLVATRSTSATLAKLHLWLERKLGLENQYNSPVLEKMRQQKLAMEQQKRMQKELESRVRRHSRQGTRKTAPTG